MEIGPPSLYHWGTRRTSLPRSKCGSAWHTAINVTPRPSRAARQVASGSSRTIVSASFTGISARSECRQQWKDVIRPEVETHAHLEHARRLAVIRRHARNRLLKSFQIVLDGDQEPLTRVRQRQLPRAPVKQPDAEIAFQRGHVP